MAHAFLFEVFAIVGNVFAVVGTERFDRFEPVVPLGVLNSAVGELFEVGGIEDLKNEEAKNKFEHLTYNWESVRFPLGWRRHTLF